MERVLSAYLDRWLRQPRRLPMVLRGARQVGKTWLVRDLAQRHGLDLVELNFERDPGRRALFEPSDPKQIVAAISLALDVDLDTRPAQSLLFLDEIQAAPAVLASLRWFAEEMPELPVVAAGSLLEFVLQDHAFSMPVGRISYCHVEPLGFVEYLLAHGQRRLLERLNSWTPADEFPDVVAERAEVWFGRYAMVGGMPAIVAADAERQDPRECRRLQRDLIATYRDDFAKYAGRMDPQILDTVLLAAVSSLGRKFVYAKAGEGIKQHQAKRALEALAAARLCHLVLHSDATGLPLGGQVKDRFRKVILADVGLVHGLIGTPATSEFPKWQQLGPQVRGQLTEQLAGQQLRLLVDDPSQEPVLYYWQRGGGRPGEIDFLVQIEARIVPVETKAGAAGSMKSLHQFVHDKQIHLAVRLDANPPSLMQLDHKTTQGNRVQYRLVSLPHYLTWSLPSVLAQLP